MGVRVEKDDVEEEMIIAHPLKKQMSMHSLLNLLGVFMMMGFGLMFFTVPLDLNEQLKWIYVEGFHDDRGAMREFFLFLITIGFIYFTLLFLHHKRLWKRSSLLVTLLCLGVMDVVFFFVSLLKDLF